jgi:hypothetical protein
MMAMSGVEILIFMLFMTPGCDLLSLADPADYFKSRNIAVSIDKMVDLATTPATDGKSQAAQLLALRYLAEDAAGVKKAKNFEEILKRMEEVAEGKKANDSLGFARDYARKTAIALGSQLKPMTPPAPQDSLTKDAMSWFPKGATIVLGADFRNSDGKENKEISELRTKLVKALPAIFKEQLYKAIDELGNVRIDRIAMAYCENAQNNADSKIFMRATGKVDHKRLVAYVKKIAPGNLQFKESKTPRGQVITQFSAAMEPPAFAVVGDNEFVIAGWERPINNDSTKVLEEMLDVVRGKAGNVLEGPLAAKLKLASPKAGGLIAGTIPESLHKNFVNGPDAIKNFPREILVEMNQQDGALQFKAQAELPNAEDAKAFVTGAEALVKKGMDELKKNPMLPPNFPNPDKLIKGATDTLKSIKVEAKGKNITGSMTLSKEVIIAYMDLMMTFLGELRGPARLQPKQVIPIVPQKPAERALQAAIH